jgi:hypothetical protein
MKFFKRLFFAVLLLVALDFGYNHEHDAAQALRNDHHRNDKVTVQQRASHMVNFFNEADEQKGLCSGQAVGPHIFLTAEHCNDHHDGNYTTVTFDYSTKKFHILAELHDKNDHVLYLLDGPAFTNFTPTLKTGEVNAGDEVVLYGDGEGAYPPRALFGYVDGEAEAADLSDIDKADGVHYFVLAAQHGDSGSAVYDLNTGYIIGLTTYGLGFHSNDSAEEVVSFALAFPADYEAQLLRIAEAPSPKNIAKKTAEEPDLEF